MGSTPAWVVRFDTAHLSSLKAPSGGNRLFLCHVDVLNALYCHQTVPYLMSCCQFKGWLEGCVCGSPVLSALAVAISIIKKLIRVPVTKSQNFCSLLCFSFLNGVIAVKVFLCNTAWQLKNIFTQLHLPLWCALWLWKLLNFKYFQNGC